MVTEKILKKTTKTAKVITEAKTPKPIKSKAVKVTTSLEIPVYNLLGVEEKKFELAKELFDIDESPLLVAQYVRVYLANQRQGNASTKLRSEVTGTTKKVYRQKGTGNARHGSKKAPLYVGGGVDGGPKPTDHSLKINKKQKRKALLSVLTTKAKEGAIIALAQDVISMTPKTKSFVSLLKVLDIDNKKVMLVVAQSATEGLKMSTRNLKKVDVVSTSNVNPYNLLNSRKVLFTEDALNVFSALYLKK